MKTIRDWRDLEACGIIALTGEACAYGYRTLCDLTPEGQALFREVFGMPVQDLKLPENWNSGQGQTASIMLPPQMFTPLAIFALFRQGCMRVYTTWDGPVYGVEESDPPERVGRFVASRQGRYCEACGRYGAGGGIQFTYANPGYARNRHQFTGRTEEMFI